MTTTIAPSAGAGLLFSQQGQGTSPGYSALDDRRSNSGALQEGVFGTSTLVTAGGVSSVAAADFMVTQRNAGANMSVDINMPTGGFAWVQGDTINGQGLYGVPVHASNINESIAASDATNPRVDQVILEVQDNVLDASGGNQARIRVLTGTPSPGTTLTTRAGASSLPGNALLLADILVPNSSSNVPNSNIRDRRKWARGGLARAVRTAGDLTTTSASFVQVSAALQLRVECSGVPTRIKLRGRWQTTGSYVALKPIIDGAGDGTVTDFYAVSISGSGNDAALNAEYEFNPAAGSHLVEFYWRAGTGTATLNANTTTPAVFTVEEIVKQNSANNTVTTG